MKKSKLIGIVAVLAVIAVPVAIKMKGNKSAAEVEKMVQQKF